MSLVGYEVDDLNVGATDGRTAVRFDFSLQAEFTVVKRDGRWTFGTSTMQSPSIGVAERYEPDHVWEVKALQCRDCEEYARTGKLWVDLNESGVRFSWGVNPIRVEVEYDQIGPYNDTKTVTNPIYFGDWGAECEGSAPLY